MRLLFPRPSSADFTAVVLNTAGGITGGDRFKISAKVAQGCHLTLTTQAAERAYRAQPGEVAHLKNNLAIGSGARANWLPQETLLYDRSALKRTLEVDLAQDAQLLAVEPVIFGRVEMGEVLSHITFRDRIEVRQHGTLVFADRTVFTGKDIAQMRSLAIGAGCTAMASIILIAPDAERHLLPVRAMMPATGGVSLIREGVLFARLLATDGYALRQILVPIIERLGTASIPRTWMI